MTLEEAIKARLKSANLDETMQFPPRIDEIVHGDLIDYREGLSMTMRFAIRAEYDNPMGRTFGGAYALFFDATFGPFSTLLTGTITTSLDLNITFIKPLSTLDEYIDIEAKVVSQSKSFVVLSGSAVNKSGDLVATCQSRMMVLNVSRMK